MASALNEWRGVLWWFWILASLPHTRHTRACYPHTTQAEMKRITNSPLFKEAMEQAQEMTTELQNDPEKMAAFMQDLQVGGWVPYVCVVGWGGVRGIWADGCVLEWEIDGPLTLFRSLCLYTHITRTHSCRRR